MMWCCNAKGSANDIMAWRYSHMYNKVYLREKIPEEYFFIRGTIGARNGYLVPSTAIHDEALVNEEQFLTPYGGRGIGISKDSFNYHLSVRR